MPSASTLTEVRKAAHALVIRPLPTPPAGYPPANRRRQHIRDRRRQRALEQSSSEQAKDSILALLGTATRLRQIGCYADAAHTLHVALRLTLRWKVAVAIGKVLPANAPLTELSGRLRSGGAMTRHRMRQINRAATIGTVVEVEQLAELIGIVRETVEGIDSGEVCRISG